MKNLRDKGEEEQEDEEQQRVCRSRQAVEQQHRAMQRINVSYDKATVQVGHAMPEQRLMLDSESELAVA